MRKLFVVLMGLILIAGNADAASYSRPLPAYNRTIVIRDSGPKIDPAAYIFGGIIAGIIIYAIIDAMTRQPQPGMPDTTRICKIGILCVKQTRQAIKSVDMQPRDVILKIQTLEFRQIQQFFSNGIICRYFFNISGRRVVIFCGGVLYI